MHVWLGNSKLEDAAAAVAEATREWEDAPDVVFAFASTKQDAAEVARAVADKAGDEAVVVGCTTSGELLKGAHANGSLAVAALKDSGVRWAAVPVTGLDGFDGVRARETVDQALSALEADREDLRPDDYFALLFIDGMRLKEESVASELTEALDGIQLAGGSAGDDLQFAETKVIVGGEALTDAAVLVIGRLEGGAYTILKHQHFSATSTLLAVTKADPATRTVIELDGLPAAEAYAAALGVKREELVGDVTFLHPVTFACDGQLYVRSIQQVTDDDTLVFYCAIEEGMVLDVGRHGSIGPELERSLEAVKDNEFILAFNCILRSLEAESKGLHDQVACAFDTCGVPMIGFDTYGEQYNGMHINQTLVALAIRSAA